jgi:hypothetical protein
MQTRERASGLFGLPRLSGSVLEILSVSLSIRTYSRHLVDVTCKFTNASCWTGAASSLADCYGALSAANIRYRAWLLRRAIPEHRSYEALN